MGASHGLVRVGHEWRDGRKRRVCRARPPEIQPVAHDERVKGRLVSIAAAGVGLDNRRSQTDRTRPEHASPHVSLRPAASLECRSIDAAAICRLPRNPGSGHCVVYVGSGDANISNLFHFQPGLAQQAAQRLFSRRTGLPARDVAIAVDQYIQRIGPRGIKRRQVGVLHQDDPACARRLC